MTVFVEDLPLVRSKAGDLYDYYRTEPHVAPGSYNIAGNVNYSGNANNSLAPFSSTSERFARTSRNTTSVLVGRYDVRDDSRSRNISSCPFRSNAKRFAPIPENLPAPGRYNVENVLPNKRGTCTHFFTRAPRIAALHMEEKTSVGDPGHYDVPCDKSVPHRPDPRSTVFGLGPERGMNKSNGVPGPGTYELNRPPKNLYTYKPSSMFASKKERASFTTKELCPGPGHYDVPSGFLCDPPDEIFSAFGTTAPRFILRDDNSPAPGSYTKEFVIRRPVPTPRNHAGGYGTAAFTSAADRFSGSATSTPGPGAYSHSGKMAKHQSFGSNAPFSSTTSRFQTSLASATGATDSADHEDRMQAPPLRFPGRVVSVRRTPSVSRSHMSATRDLSYDVKYDWPKPHTSRESDFPRARRRCTILPSKFASSIPGPGAYDKGCDRALDTMSTRHANSSWSKAIRSWQDQARDGVGSPGPGYYYSGSTFLKPTHNATITSDTTWLHAV